MKYPIQFHFNLNLKQWSYKLPEQPTSNCITAILQNVTVKHPSPNNKQFIICLEGGKRKVFAWFKVNKLTINPRVNSVQANLLGERIYFNPTKGDKFFHFRRNGKKFKVDYLSKVYALSNGETYGVL